MKLKESKFDHLAYISYIKFSQNLKVVSDIKNVVRWTDGQAEPTQHAISFYVVCIENIYLWCWCFRWEARPQVLRAARIWWWVCSCQGNHEVRWTWRLLASVSTSGPRDTVSALRCRILWTLIRAEQSGSTLYLSSLYGCREISTSSISDFASRFLGFIIWNCIERVLHLKLKINNCSIHSLKSIYNQEIWIIYANNLITSMDQFFSRNRRWLSKYVTKFHYHFHKIQPVDSILNQLYLIWTI